MQNKMMQKPMMKNATFYIFAAVFVACYLTKTAECYRRRKPLRTDVREEADPTKPMGVHEGEILFGKYLKGPESQLLGGMTRPSSNASVEDEAGYQSDVPGFPYDQTYLDAWNQMTKSLQCGADQMDFKVVGSGNQHFAVNQFNGPPLPLPLVPPSCGYNMRRLPFFLRMSIPYSGCNIIKEGGLYRLPLTWRGIPVVLSCQGPPPPQTPPLPPFYINHPWLPVPPQIPKNPQVPLPVDFWSNAQTPDFKPWDLWMDNPTEQPPFGPPFMLPFGAPFVPPTAPPAMPPFGFPWYHDPHYQNYPYLQKHPHNHPYWPHVKAPTPDSPPMTTMIPYDPVHHPPYVPVKGKVYTNTKS